MFIVLSLILLPNAQTEIRKTNYFLRWLSRKVADRERDVTYFLPNLLPCGAPRNKYQIHVLIVKYRVL